MNSRPWDCPYLSGGTCNGAFLCGVYLEPKCVTEMPEHGWLCAYPGCKNEPKLSFTVTKEAVIVGKEIPVGHRVSTCNEHGEEVYRDGDKAFIRWIEIAIPNRSHTDLPETS